MYSRVEWYRTFAVFENLHISVCQVYFYELNSYFRRALMSHTRGKVYIFLKLEGPEKLVFFENLQKPSWYGTYYTFIKEQSQDILKLKNV